MNTQASFEASEYFHIYSRTNNRELLFRSDENRRFFLQRLKHFCEGFMTFHSYSLLPNHFHLLVSIKSGVEIEQYLHWRDNEQLNSIQKNFLDDGSCEELVHSLITRQFQGFFTSYSKAFNKRHHRTGNLFNRPYKRSKVFTTSKLLYLHYYIIHNARKHRIVSKFENHRWNSYKEIVSCNSTWLERDGVIELFGGMSEYMSFIQSRENSELYLGLAGE